MKPEHANDERFFDFEKLEVYQLALQFLDRLFMLCRALPADIRFPVADQLIRAGLSISNNLAEGSGKRSQKERARYYGTAIDSARERLSMINVLYRQRAVDADQFKELRGTGQRITGMLFGLIDSLDRTPYTVHRSQCS
ncbi:MAG: four helix bundle protein [Candidatus Omnitrophica bacterium]|nr:four helix bundle protein [Candidatus Omnitrophota bacterium]